MIAPPRKAIPQRVRVEICGPLLVSTFKRPLSQPETKPPIATPNSDAQQVSCAVDVVGGDGVLGKHDEVVHTAGCPQPAAGEEESAEKHDPQYDPGQIRIDV